MCIKRLVRFLERCCTEATAVAMALALQLSATSAGSHTLTTRCVGAVHSASKIGYGSVAVNDRTCGGVLRHQVDQLWHVKEAALVRAASVVRRSAESPSGSVEVAVGGITEVGNDTFYPFLKDAGEKVVVLDMYTQWCGPCKLMLPKVLKLSESYTDVLFAKLDCNQENKPLAKELGVKTVPTFKIFKNAEVVGEVRGAKYDELVKAIESARLLS